MEEDRKNREERAKGFKEAENQGILYFDINDA